MALPAYYPFYYLERVIAPLKPLRDNEGNIHRVADGRSRLVRKRTGGDMERKLAGAFFGIVIVVAVAFFGVVTPGFADDYVQEDGISYFANETEKTATVSHCDTSVSGAVSISKTISFNGESYPVVGIEERAFDGCASLESVMIPESIISIESNAFSGCSNLKDILVSEQTTLGTDVFSDTNESLHVWRYEIAESAATSADGKTHLKIVSVQDKNGATVSNSSDIPDGVITNGYVVDKGRSGGDPSAVYYDVWVAGVQVSNLNADDVLGDSDEGATVTYDENSATLTLNNANLAVSDRRFAIYAEQDLTIALIGDNSVTLDGSVEISGLTWQTSIAGGYVVPEPAAPIACKGGSLTVRNGSNNRGSLTATNDVKISYMNDNGSFMNCGIVATGTVDIRDAKVEASSSYVHADNGATECSYGIFAGQGIAFDGADVTAMGDEATWSAGVYSLTGDVRLNGSAKASGGRAVNHQNPYSAFSSGIYANEGSVCITGGNVETVAASLTEGGAAYGIFGYHGISITGGTVHAIGATSNVDGVNPIFGVGIYSSAGDVVISGTSTQVEADGGFASEDIAGIYAHAGNVLITDASVKASAQTLYDADDGTSVGIYAGTLQIARSNSETGNIVLKGANVQTVGLTDSVQFSGNLTVIPAEGMWYSVDTLEEARLGYPNLLWGDMATAAKGIQGSPFKTETSLDGNLVSGNQYLHFYNVADESVVDPGNPDDPTVSEVLDKSKDSNDPDTSTDAKIPVLGESSLALPLILVACFALAVGVVALIRKREC